MNISGHIPRVHRVIEVLIDDELGGFKSGKGCVDLIFTLNQICESIRHKKRRGYVSFMDLEIGSPYDRS